MKLRALLILIISIFLSDVQAQLIGDEALRRLENGQATTLEGQFVAYLADSVSPDFIEKQLSQLGYKYDFLEIKPVMIRVANSPEQEVLDTIFSQPEVMRFIQQSIPADSLNFKEQLRNQGIDENRINDALERYLSNHNDQLIQIWFDYQMTERLVMNFMTNYRSVAYQFFPILPKTVNILVEPGTEREIMMEVDQLPFVEYTALIGVIGE